MIRMLDIEGKGQVGYTEFYKMATGQSLAPIGTAHPPSLGMMSPDARLTKRTLIPTSNSKLEVSPKPTLSREYIEYKQLEFPK